MNRDDIINFLKEHRSELEARFGVIKIGLFGSFARNEAYEQSDIDILVELKKDHISDHYFALLHYLEDTLGRKIDLGIASGIKPAIRKYVDQDIIYV